MIAALLALALQSGGLPGVPVHLPQVFGDPTVAGAPTWTGTKTWFELHRDVGAGGIVTCAASGDWNADFHLDAAVLVGGELVAIVAPAIGRGGMRVGTTEDLVDFTVEPGAGPGGEDALLTVGASGLARYRFENNLDRFLEDSLDSDLWAGARTVRTLDLGGTNGTLYVGVAANGLDVIAFDPDQELSLTLYTHVAPVRALEVLDWLGDDEEELALLTDRAVAVVDVRALVLAVVEDTQRSSVALATFRRALEPYERLAWITDDASTDATGPTAQRLQALADGIVEPSVELGDLGVVGLAAADFDGDGSDELFLSHASSAHQVVLRSQAVLGDPFSSSFDAEAFQFLGVLPEDSLLADRPGTIAFPPEVGGGVGQGGGGTPPMGVQGVVGGGGAGGTGGSGSSTSAPSTAGSAQGLARGSGKMGIATPTPGLPLVNPFARNRAVPATGDFDADGDQDLLMPVSLDAGFLFHRSDLVDHRELLARTFESSLNSAGPDALRLDFNVYEPEVLPPTATHIELVVWHSAGFAQAPVGEAVAYKHFALSGEWPADLDFLMDESELPFHAHYHMQVRLVELDPELGDAVVDVWPSTTATYTSVQPLFEALFASNAIRGGGVTTPKTGPVFVGGIAPRPHLDPFAPGTFPRAPGGGQVK